LNKTLAKEFYRLNSGFFMLIGTLTFGFMSGVEHKALAQYFVSSPYTMLIPAGVWILYTLKILAFNNRQLNQDENRILFNMAFLSSAQQTFCTALFFTLQFLPALCYGIFLSGIAWTLQAYQSILMILVALLACCAVSAVILIRSCHNPFREKKVSSFRRFIDHQFHKPVLQFYIEWILRKDPLMLAGIKIFSGALILAVCILYATEDYDWRFISMAITGCGIANLLILFQLQDFEHAHIGWIKNLPITLARRYLRLMIVIVFFLIPESVVLVKYFPAHLHPYWMMLNLFYLLALCMFFFGFLHIRSRPLENFTRKAFWIFITLILLILFKVPLISLCILNFTAGYLLYSRNYYLFEPYREQTGD
jgi:hypothetical protein